MSGLEVEEPVLQPGRIGVLLGQGQTAQVLRNLCLMVYRESKQDWAKIVGLMERLFQLKLGDPMENSRGAIDLNYEQPGVKEPLALSSSGRGFQQMLLILAYLYSHKRSVLMVDEPDAHLEILRQKQVFLLLRDIASENGSQAVMVTHSEVILDEALDTNLTLVFDGHAENLAKQARIRESLKLFGTAHYVRARQRGYVVYVEGSTDVTKLRALAELMQHPAAAVWDESPNVYFVENVHGEPSLESELERVEGGFGLPPKEHFNGLRKLLPGLQGMAILDSDGRDRRQTETDGLRYFCWRRYELENYFVTPELLLDFVRHVNPELGLFEIAIQEAEDVLARLIREKVFAGEETDYAVWEDASADAKRLIWEAKTEKLKLSTFAEAFFENLAKEAKMDVVLRKGEFHQLIRIAKPETIPHEVSEKLDALEVLFRQAAPLPG